MHNQPIGWTTTDSGRRIIVPESMLTKLGGAEVKLTSISETNEKTTRKKKSKKSLEKKLKVESQNYLVNENRPSSVEYDFGDTQAMIRSKPDVKQRKYEITQPDFSRQTQEQSKNEESSSGSQMRRNSLTRLQSIDETAEEKRLQSIIKEKTNGESVKTSLSNIKVAKKVTYASSTNDKINEIDAFVNELDENLDESGEKRKKKKKKSKKKEHENNEDTNA